MIVLLRFLPVLLEIGLLVYCLIDCIQTPAEDCRNLGKGWWVLLILFFPIVGPIAWLVAGRPQRSRYAGWRQGAGFPESDRPRPARGPDDDADFVAGLREVNDEHEQTLKKWEEDLRRRESELRRDDDPKA